MENRYFNYSILSEEVAHQLRSATSEIKVLMCRTTSNIIEIGLRLNQIKSSLPEWTWTAWINSEFSMSERTARYYMSAARTFPNFADNPNFSVSIGVLRQLSSQKTSAIVAPIITDKVNAGELIDDATAIGIIDASKSIEVGETVRVTGNHELKGQSVLITEVDGPIVSVVYNHREYTLMPAEIGIEPIVKQVKPQKKQDYLMTVQSHNDLLIDELETLKSHIKELVSLIKQGTIIPDYLLEILSNV